jgi:hypothetical protein
MLATWTNCPAGMARVHTFSSPLSERERNRERGRERERERKREKEGEKKEHLFLKGMTGVLAPFSYLVLE